MSRRWIGAALLAVIALAGCGAVESSDSDGGAAPAPAAPEEAGAPPPAGMDQDRGPDGGEAGELVSTRAIIYTGELTVRVGDVDEAASQAGELAQRYGGFVSGDRRATRDDVSSATLVLRIPSEDFYAAVDALSQLGEEESREIETEDVTTEVVDLQTRIATAEASVERTRALLEDAESITEIVAIEQELTDREETLGRLQARQDTLADLTTLSTVSVRLLSPEAQAEEDEPATGFLAGLRAGWNAFTASATVVVTIFGAVLPFLIAIGVPIGAGWWWARRRRRLAPQVASAQTPEP